MVVYEGINSRRGNRNPAVVVSSGLSRVRREMMGLVTEQIKRVLAVMDKGS